MQQASKTKTYYFKIKSVELMTKNNTFNLTKYKHKQIYFKVEGFECIKL